MKLRQRIHKADGSTEATHRLTDIEVNEVSIVDRGANKRKYLVVKQANAPETSDSAGKEKPAEGPAPSSEAAASEGTKPTEDVEKAGRKISGARMKQLLTMRDTIEALLADVSEKEPEASDEAASQEVETQKAAPVEHVPNPELEEIKCTVAELVKAVEKMAVIFDKQNQQIESLAKSRGASRQADLDAPREAAPQKKVVWDLDMASPIKTVQ